MEEIEWPFEGRPRQGKNVLPDGLNQLCYLAGSSKSHLENSISCIFLESPHQVDMKNVVKCFKHFFGYFNALKTPCVSEGRRGQYCTLQLFGHLHFTKNQLIWNANFKPFWVKIKYIQSFSTYQMSKTVSRADPSFWFTV